MGTSMLETRWVEITDRGRSLVNKRMLTSAELRFLDAVDRDHTSGRNTTLYVNDAIEEGLVKQGVIRYPRAQAELWKGQAKHEEQVIRRLAAVRASIVSLQPQLQRMYDDIKGSSPSWTEGPRAKAADFVNMAQELINELDKYVRNVRERR